MGRFYCSYSEGDEHVLCHTSYRVIALRPMLAEVLGGFGWCRADRPDRKVKVVWCSQGYYGGKMNDNDPPTLEFFFDCSSPWTYLAFSQIETVAKRSHAQLVWKPILVGGVFNTVNSAVYEQRANPDPRKAAYYRDDLQLWAKAYGLRIGSPPVFPVRSVEAMRGAFFALDQDRLPAYARAVFESYWSDLKDISQKVVLEEICERVGLDFDAYWHAVKSDDLKARLKETTDELIDRGGFGSPTIFVNKDRMFFGNDRLPLVEAVLRRQI